MSDDTVQIIRGLYDRFNARDIDGVFVSLADNVTWANGMDGGYVHGLDAIREYWTRQWSVVSPHIEPVDFTENESGDIVVEVIQSVSDLDGNPLQGQSHGLKDKTVRHVFHFEDAKITRFDIQD